MSSLACEKGDETASTEVEKVLDETRSNSWC